MTLNMSDDEKSVSGKPSSTGSENDAVEGYGHSVDVKGATSSSRELAASCDALRRLRRYLLHPPTVRMILVKLIQSCADSVVLPIPCVQGCVLVITVCQPSTVIPHVKLLSNVPHYNTFHPHFVARP